MPETSKLQLVDVDVARDIYIGGQPPPFILELILQAANQPSIRLEAIYIIRAKSAISASLKFLS